MADEGDRPTGATQAAERLPGGQRFPAPVAVLQPVKSQFGYLDLWVQGVHPADVAGPRRFRLSPSRPRDTSTPLAYAMEFGAVVPAWLEGPRRAAIREASVIPTARRLSPLPMRRAVVLGAFGRM